MASPATRQRIPALKAKSQIEFLSTHAKKRATNYLRGFTHIKDFSVLQERFCINETKNDRRSKFKIYLGHILIKLKNKIYLLT